MIYKQKYLKIDGTLKGITTLGQSEPGSNGNEWIIFWKFGLSHISIHSKKIFLSRVSRQNL